MSEVSFTLEEVHSDFRGYESTLVLTVINSPEDTIHIHDVFPQLPIGVTLVETRSFASMSRKEKRQQLSEELAELANRIIEARSVEIQTRLVEIERDEAVDDDPTIKKTFSRFMYGAFEGVVSRLKRAAFPDRARRLQDAFKSDSRRRPYLVEVESANDADHLLGSWFFKDEDRETTIESARTQDLFELFKIKLKKLRSAEQEAAEDSNPRPAPIAIVEPGGRYIERFSLRAVREELESIDYNIAVGVAYSVADSTETTSSVASTTITVSPFPATLTAAAIVSAILGVVLNNAVNVITTQGARLVFYTPSGFAEGIAAVILSLVVFNVYEFTEMFRGIRSRLSWRHALFIGVACGLGVERVFSVFDAILGTRITG